jgi:chromate reductase, NAD(P)H dehydrogenase (quinone)
MERDDTALHVVGLCGSLRRGSFNRRLLELAREVAPNSIELVISPELGSVPLFNEDLEGPDHVPPPPVRVLRQSIADADAILIATPEYNQSMPGVVKNAIDWLSRPAPDSAFEGKLVALCGITTGEWGTRLSQAALRQTLFATGARLVPLHLYLRRAEQAWPTAHSPDIVVTDQVRDFMGALAIEVAHGLDAET